MLFDNKNENHVEALQVVKETIPLVLDQQHPTFISISDKSICDAIDNYLSIQEDFKNTGIDEEFVVRRSYIEFSKDNELEKEYFDYILNTFLIMFMTTKKAIIDHVVGIEGGYSDNVYDSGGKTKYGITENLARRYGYYGNMKDLSMEKAFDIYELEFWNPLWLDEIVKDSYDIALEIFDTAVNMGKGTASEFLQRSLNVLNNKQKYYDDISVDGIMGQNTIDAFHRYMDRRGHAEGEKVLLKALNCLQGSYYIRLAEEREKDETFLYGWLRARI